MSCCFSYLTYLFSANTVFMTDMPPPYPGINGYQGYATAPPSNAMGFAASAPMPSAAGQQLLVVIINL